MVCGFLCFHGTWTPRTVYPCSAVLTMYITLVRAVMVSIQITSARTDFARSCDTVTPRRPIRRSFGSPSVVKLDFDFLATTHGATYVMHTPRPRVVTNSAPSRVVSSGFLSSHLEFGMTSSDVLLGCVHFQLASTSFTRVDAGSTLNVRMTEDMGYRSIFTNRHRSVVHVDYRISTSA